MRMNWIEPICIGNGDLDSIRAFRGRLLRGILGCCRICSFGCHTIPSPSLCWPYDSREAAFGSHTCRLCPYSSRKADASLCRTNLRALHVHLPFCRIHRYRKGDGHPLRDRTPHRHGHGRNSDCSIHLARRTPCISSN